MNTQGGFCDLAVLTLERMAIKKFKNSWATKRKAVRAQWVKTAAFCHNRALQDLYPDNYRLLFSTGFLTLAASPLPSDPDVLRVQRVRTEG
jgi:hypothetical protein